MHAKGFSTRDIGLLTGVSSQRVSQVLASAKGAVPTVEELVEIVVGRSKSPAVEQIANPPATAEPKKRHPEVSAKTKNTKMTVTH